MVPAIRMRIAKRASMSARILKGEKPADLPVDAANQV